MTKKIIINIRMKINRYNRWRHATLVILPVKYNGAKVVKDLCAKIVTMKFIQSVFRSIINSTHRKG
jgi:hypothetical protein